MVSAPDATLRLLVVDDGEDMQALYRRRLRRQVMDGRVVLSFARSGAEALERVLGEGAPVDVVLTDIRMPAMSGLELLARLKGERPGLRVIVISAYGDEDNITRARALGAERFYVKPIPFDELLHHLLG